MARNVTFKERDLRAALRAAAAAGVKVARIEVTKSGIVIIPSGEAVPPDPDPGDPPSADPETAAALEAVKNAKI